MGLTTRWPRLCCVGIAALVSAFAAKGELRAQTQQDPHRPPCADARCGTVESFLKLNYCGTSPAGNGPDNGCEIKLPAKPGVMGQQPSSAVRSLLVRELRRLGLPADSRGKTTFKAFKSTSAGWLVAAAYYSRLRGSNVDLCQVVVFIDKSSRVLVLRQVPFQKTDADVPHVTEWSVIDLADADGDGQPDVILEGDAYEDHWFEVVAVQQGRATTVFSGLGYYL